MLVIICLFILFGIYVVIKLLHKDDELNTTYFYNPKYYYEEDKRETYSSLLRTPEWYNYRTMVFNYKGYKCEWCGRTNNLQVHHKFYLKRYGEFIKPWEYDFNNVMVLCNYCHKKYHRKYKVNVYNI